MMAVVFCFCCYLLSILIVIWFLMVDFSVHHSHEVEIQQRLELEKVV